MVDLEIVYEEIDNLTEYIDEIDVECKKAVERIRWRIEELQCVVSNMHAS